MPVCLCTYVWTLTKNFTISYTYDIPWNTVVITNFFGGGVLRLTYKQVTASHCYCVAVRSVFKHLTSEILFASVTEQLYTDVVLGL